jgi:hypothetical protein
MHIFEMNLLYLKHLLLHLLRFYCKYLQLFKNCIVVTMEPNTCKIPIQLSIEQIKACQSHNVDSLVTISPEHELSEW